MRQTTDLLGFQRSVKYIKTLWCIPMILIQLHAHTGGSAALKERHAAKGDVGKPSWERAGRLHSHLRHLQPESAGGGGGVGQGVAATCPGKPQY